MKRLFLLEDDLSLISGLSFAVKKQGYEIDAARTILEADTLWANGSYDLAILDVSLPDGSGFDFCRKIRRMSKVPVMFLTAADEETDIIMGLDMGGDDYITKPFNPLEVVARVKTQLRRYQKYNNPVQNQPFQKSEYDIRGLIINKDTHKCSLFGKEVSLTPIEFSILWYLCEHQGKVISSEELFENVWKEKYLDNNNTVMAHIGRLRGKLNEPAKKPKFIKTVWGIGYEIE